jgi:hypothetical protein
MAHKSKWRASLWLKVIRRYILLVEFKWETTLTSMLVSALQIQFIIRIFNWCTSRRADLIEIPDRIRFITGALIKIAPTDDGWWFALSLLLIRPENIFSLAHSEKMEINVSLCWRRAGWIPRALTHKLTHPSIYRVWTIRTQSDKCMCATNERLLNVSTQKHRRDKTELLNSVWIVVVAGIEMHLAGAARTLKP